MGKDKTQTTTQTLDPETQAFVEKLRAGGTEAAEFIDSLGPIFLGPDGRSISEQLAPFLNPFTDQVIGGVNENFDRNRSAARRDVSQAATRSGAFNSSRQGVAEGIRLSELDRSEGQVVSGLLSDQFNTALSQGLNFSEYQRALRERQLQEGIFKRQTRQGLLSGSIGPSGSSTTQIQEGSLIGDISGLGLLASSFFAPGAATALSSTAGFQSPKFTPPGFNF